MNIRTSILPVLATALGALAITVTSALAAVEAPRTEHASEVKAETAVLNGVLSPTGPGEVGSTYEFLYKASTTQECRGGSATSPVASIMGLQGEPVSEPVTGLKPGVEYAVCLVVHNAAKTKEAAGLAVTFTTVPVPANEPVTLIGARTATFNGKLTPSTSVGAEYVFFYNVGETAACTNEFQTGGSSAEPVEIAATGLEPDQKYTVCLYVLNASGATQEASPPEHFETKPAPPAVEAEPVSSVTSSEARLEATVNADNQEVTECHFEYGTDPALATSTTVGCEPATLAGVYGGQGVDVSVSGLVQQSTYYYRVLVKNTTGEEKGGIAHFTTLPQTPKLEAPSPLAGTTATLRGVLSPTATAAGEAGSYEFVYRQSATECQGGENGEEKRAPEPAGVTVGLPGEAVSVPVTGLLPHTQYTLCLLARNGAGEAALSAPVTFTTPTIAPEIENESTSEVSATEARLEAVIDPGGLETSYRFEYGSAAGSYDVSIPIPDGEIPAGVSAVNVSAVATGLQPSATYHYRVLATNAQSPAAGTPGADATFTTVASAGSSTPGVCPNEQARTEQPYGSTLPDCRAYEMVSPLDKNGAGIVGVDSRASVPGPGEPQAITYASMGSFSEPQGEELTNRYISRRETDGWSTQNITSPHTPGYLELNDPFRELLFTPSLLQGLTSEYGFPLVAGEPAGYATLYLADLAATPVSYQAVQGATPGSTPYREGNDVYGPVPAGASTDLSHVVFQWNADLTPGATGNGYHVYEWVAGKLSQVDVPPTGMEFDKEEDVVGATGAFPIKVSEGDKWHAVSDNALRVFFTAGEGGSAEGQLYVRENPEQPPVDASECAVSGDACTIEVSKSQRTVPDPNGEYEGYGGKHPRPAFYRDASANGSRVFFTSRVELTNDANTGDPESCKAAPRESERNGDCSANLYEYNLETKELTDLTAVATSSENPNGGAVLGLVNAGENAGEENSYMYFVADGVLASNKNSNEEAAKPGNCKQEIQNNSLRIERTCSLYVAHYDSGKWETKFIATLAGGVKEVSNEYDEADWYGEEGRGYDDGPGQHSARVTPDGGVLAFQSVRGLTGYDNEPVEPGAEGGGKRCTAYGGNPAATDPAVPCREVYLYDAATEKLVCASCDPSGARPVGPAELGGQEEELGAGFLEFSPFYLSRNLSEDGRRLFFQSRDPLVPHDSNGEQNVYEWEAAGEGSCARAGGCVFPISDVAGDYMSVFMDASSSGDDVFIDTADQLVPSDTDTRADVYDVRVGGGFPVAPTAPECDNGDSCKPPVSPQPGVFGPTGSATFSGVGNFPAGGREPNPPAAKPKSTKKTVKCKKDKKLSHGKCMKQKSKKKAKMMKQASHDRRTNR